MTHEFKVPKDLEDLIPGFLKNREADIKRLEEAFGRADYEALKKIGHELKGACGSYGFDQMSQLGKKIEEAALKKNNPMLQKFIQDFSAMLKDHKIVYIEE